MKGEEKRWKSWLSFFFLHSGLMFAAILWSLVGVEPAQSSGKPHPSARAHLYWEHTAGKPHPSARAHLYWDTHCPGAELIQLCFGSQAQLAGYSECQVGCPHVSAPTVLQAQFVWIFQLFCGVFLAKTPTSCTRRR